MFWKFPENLRDNNYFNSKQATHYLCQKDQPWSFSQCDSVHTQSGQNRNMQSFIWRSRLHFQYRTGPWNIIQLLVETQMYPWCMHHACIHDPDTWPWYMHVFFTAPLNFRTKKKTVKQSITAAVKITTLYISMIYITWHMFVTRKRGTFSYF